MKTPTALYYIINEMGIMEFSPTTDIRNIILWLRSLDFTGDVNKTWVAVTTTNSPLQFILASQFIRN